MHIKVTGEKDNAVLQRKELTAELNYEGGPTPKSADVAAELAKSRGIDAGLVEMTCIANSKGRTAGTAKAKIWNSAEAREKFKAHKRKKQVKKEGAEAEAQK